MRKFLITLVVVAPGLAGGLLAGCGDRNGLLPRTDADALKASVDRVAAAVARRDCASATIALQRAQDRADRLPASVNPKLRNNIYDGLSQLLQDVEAKCSTTTTSTQTQTVPSETTTTPTQTTTTSTQTTTTTQPGTTTTDQTQSTPNGTGGTPSGQQGQRGGGQN